MIETLMEIEQPTARAIIRVTRLSAIRLRVHKPAARQRGQLYKACRSEWILFACLHNHADRLIYMSVSHPLVPYFPTQLLSHKPFTSLHLPFFFRLERAQVKALRILQRLHRPLHLALPLRLTVPSLPPRRCAAFSLRGIFVLVSE